MVPYIRMLHAKAFDNVKDIMREMALSPAMGEFLDMVNNKKADPKTNTLPNENYAREWLQLLSIGLQELNDNGTPRLGTTGQPIPTYDQNVIMGFAAIVIDVGVLRNAQQNLWNSLDSGAIAGAELLRDDPANAEATALKFANLNYPGGLPPGGGLVCLCVHSWPARS